MNSKSDKMNELEELIGKILNHPIVVKIEEKASSVDWDFKLRAYLYSIIKNKSDKLVSEQTVQIIAEIKDLGSKQFLTEYNDLFFDVNANLLFSLYEDGKYDIDMKTNKKIREDVKEMCSSQISEDIVEKLSKLAWLFTRKPDELAKINVKVKAYTYPQLIEMFDSKFPIKIFKNSDEIVKFLCGRNSMTEFKTRIYEYFAEIFDEDYKIYFRFLTSRFSLEEVLRIDNTDIDMLDKNGRNLSHKTLMSLSMDSFTWILKTQYINKNIYDYSGKNIVAYYKNIKNILLFFKLIDENDIDQVTVLEDYFEQAIEINNKIFGSNNGSTHYYESYIGKNFIAQFSKSNIKNISLEYLRENWISLKQRIDFQNTVIEYFSDYENRISTTSLVKEYREYEKLIVNTYTLLDDYTLQKDKLNILQCEKNISEYTYKSLDILDNIFQKTKEIVFDNEFTTLECSTFFKILNKNMQDIAIYNNSTELLREYDKYFIQSLYHLLKSIPNGRTIGIKILVYIFEHKKNNLAEKEKNIAKEILEVIFSSKVPNFSNVQKSSIYTYYQFLINYYTNLFK